MDSFEIMDNLDAMNWNELSSIIKKATEFRSIMEKQAIAVMMNAQDIMKENNTQKFPDSEHEALYEFLGFKGSYKQAIGIMRSFARRKSIRFAVAAFAESTNYPITEEYKTLLRKLYQCGPIDEPVTKTWKEARERFWKEF